jgi:pilus assembly protein Flp/PilA
MCHTIRLLFRNEQGTAAIEYALLAGIVVVAVAAVGASFDTTVSTLFASMWTKITATASAA